jgi:hypothetical protein
VDSMDSAIRFFLTADEFQRHVINKEPLES